MSKKTYTAQEIEAYDGLYRMVVSNLDHIGTAYPRSKVLYPMMKKVVFQDFITLLDGTYVAAERLPANDE